MRFDPQKARVLAARPPNGVNIYTRRKYALSAALDRIEELEMLAAARCEAMQHLQAEGQRALETIDDQAAVIRDLRERLAGVKA